MESIGEMWVGRCWEKLETNMKEKKFIFMHRRRLLHLETYHIIKKLWKKTEENEKYSMHVYGEYIT